MSRGPTFAISRLVPHRHGMMGPGATSSALLPPPRHVAPLATSIATTGAAGEKPFMRASSRNGASSFLIPPEGTALRVEAARGYFAAYGKTVRTHDDMRRLFGNGLGAAGLAAVTATVDSTKGGDAAKDGGGQATAADAFLAAVVPKLSLVEDRMISWKMQNWDFRVPALLNTQEKESAIRQLRALQQRARELLTQRYAAKQQMVAVMALTGVSSEEELNGKTRGWVLEQVAAMRWRGEIDKAARLRDAWVALEKQGSQQHALFDRLCCVYGLGMLGTFDHAFANTIREVDVAAARASAAVSTAKTVATDKKAKKGQQQQTTSPAVLSGPAANGGGQRCLMLDSSNPFKELLAHVVAYLPTIHVLYDFTGFGYVHSDAVGSLAASNHGRGYRSSLEEYAIASLAQQALATLRQSAATATKGGATPRSKGTGAPAAGDGEILDAAAWTRTVGRCAASAALPASVTSLLVRHDDSGGGAGVSASSPPHGRVLFHATFSTDTQWPLLAEGDAAAAATPPRPPWTVVLYAMPPSAGPFDPCPIDLVFVNGHDLTLITIASPNRYRRRSQLPYRRQLKGIARRAAMLFGLPPDDVRVRTLMLPPTFMDRVHLEMLTLALRVGPSARDGDDATPLYKPVVGDDSGGTAGQPPAAQGAAESADGAAPSVEAAARAARLLDVLVPASCRVWFDLYDKQLAPQDSNFAEQQRKSNEEEWVKL